MHAPATTHAKRAQRRFLAVLGALSVLSLGLLSSPLHAGEPGPLPAPKRVAEAEGRVIVKYRAGAALRASAYSAKVGPQQARALGLRLGLSLQDGRALSERSQVLMAQGLSSTALVQALAKHPDVEWVVEDRRRFVRAVPNDQFFPNGLTTTTPVVGQWYLRAPDSTFVSAINAQAAWDRTKGGGNLVVAVLDTGIRPNHPDLQGKILPGYDFVGFSAPAAGYSTADALAFANDGDLADADPADPGDWITAAEAATTRFDGCEASDSSWHGTQVAGLIGASTNNGIGMAGAGWDAKILPVRVLGKCGGYDSEIIAGMKWAAGLAVPGTPSNSYPAKVVNLSLGSTGACGAAYTEAIAQLTAAKATVVVAAGNEGLAVGAPANCAGVVSVAGVRHAGTKVGYSNLGPEVTLGAPAGNCGQDTGPCLYSLITTTDTGATSPSVPSYSNGSNYSVGTSFAAPLVSATVSLMQAIKPDATPAQIIAALRSSARAFPSSGAGAGVSACQAPSGVAQESECYCTSTTCGAGMLNAAAAVAAMSGAAPTSSFSYSPASLTVGVNVALNGQSSTAAAGRTLTAYQWAITAGGTLANFSGATNAVTATLSPVASGAVTVQLTVTDDLGTTHVSSQTLNIAAAPGPQPVLESSGGGSTSPLWLLLLACCAALLGRRRSA
ncbi:S8 family serine peptidase [Ideonella sp.]|uniref:S8 family serine peptidase n=1 Tax=Ideonella sp. TaxID=1929293 RepID=UPI0037BE3D7E